MKNKIILPYGKNQTAIILEENQVSDILTPRDPEHIPEPYQEVLRALKEPIGSKDLASLVHQKRKIVIICDDNTRPTPAHIILPFMLKEMFKGGALPENIKVIIAAGTHRPMTHEELIQKLGADVVQQVEVINHDYLDSRNLVDLGYTSRGTPVTLNRYVYEADFSVGVGCIVPHLVPGFSGGAKIVQPGVCGKETTAATHLASLRWSEKTFLGVVENPIREDLEEVADIAGVKHVFNVVMDRNSRLVKAFFGDMKMAYRQGVKTCKSVYGVNVKSKTPIVIASSHPCDIDFWQAHKTLYPAEMIVEKGGTIIVVTPCPEGISPTHPELQEFVGLEPSQIDKKIEQGDIKDLIAGAAGLQWSKVRQHAEVVLVTKGIKAGEAARLGFLHAESIEKALDYALKRHGRESKINVLTHAPDTLPLLKE